MIKRSKIIAVALTSIVSLSACGREVDCDITDDHIHYYKTFSGIERLMEGEKEYNGEYQRTDDYVLRDEYYETIVDNGFLILKDNMDYVEKRFLRRKDDSRLELVYYTVPEHYGLKYEASDEGFGNIDFGLVEEKNVYYWEEIALDEYTENPVKDVTYGILLYCINEDGSIESKVFTDLDSIEEGYDYFKTGTLISQIVSDEYYLEPNKKKEKVFN